MKLHRFGHQVAYQHAIAMFAVVLLLFANISHLHVRYCLDGDGPLVSIHTEAPSTHSDHSEHGDDSSDVEEELSLDTVIAKVLDDSQYIAALHSTFFATIVIPNVEFGYTSFATLHTQTTPYRNPPLRAPPAIA